MPERSVRKSVTEEQAAAVHAAEQKDVKTDLVYPVEKLRANCMKLFGITTSTFDGAMHGQKKAEMTIAEAKSIIDTWLGGKEK